jgi:uncharacterized protein YcgI (DUF1989 family)
VRLTLRLNDQQRALVDELLAAPGAPAALDDLLANAVRHDIERARDGRLDDRYRTARPAGREPSPHDPRARVDALVDAGTGLGVALNPGERVRIEQVVEGQCADLTACALGDDGRRFDAARTRAHSGLRPTTGAVLYSAPPEVPLLEIVEDTAGPHDLGFPACSAGEFAAVCAQEDHSNCTELQRETRRHWGLHPAEPHDPLNLWLPTGVLPDGRLCWWPVACRRGDFVTLRALTAVLVVVNPCASDLFGASQWELGPIRVIVHGEDAPPATPSGPPPSWRWRDMPVHEVPAAIPDALGEHVGAVRERGWLGFTDAEVARALLFRWWEDAVLGLGDVSR